jgi:hypothetical protein
LVGGEWRRIPSTRVRAGRLSSASLAPIWEMLNWCIRNPLEGKH